MKRPFGKIPLLRALLLSVVLSALPLSLARAVAAPTSGFAAASLLVPLLFAGLSLALVATGFLLARNRRLKREARRMATNERRLLAMTAPLPGGMFQALHSPGAPPRFVYADPQLERVFGISTAELLDNPSALELHPDDQQRFAAQWSYAAHPGSRLQFTGRLLAGGEQRWCLVLADVAPLEEPDSGAADRLLFSGVILDVNERQRSEEALRENERRFRTLAQNLPGAVYRSMMDEERTMLYISDGVQDLLGYPGSDFIGGALRSLAEIIHPQDLPQVSRALARAAAPDIHEDGYACEYRVTTAQGATRWIYDKGQAVRSEHDPDDVLFLDGLMLDISAQKEAEETMRQAKELADQANQAKGDFLARMSHEIRTPMNAVLGMCHLALQTELDARQRDYLLKLQTAAKSLLGIINDILDFSKIEAGKLEMESVPFRLRAVLENVENLVGLPAGQKGLELQVELPPDVPQALQGDPLRLGQVLINLANNAVKFTEQGFVALRVALVSQSAEGVLLRFSVQDSGIGLSQEQIGKLFQSFSQADGSITRKYGGTGLGLAICKRLVELMQGDIEVHSTPGRGSTFSFTALFGLPSQAPPEETGRSDSRALEHIRGARVLLADDNEINRQIARELLQQAGLVVEEAANGQEALDKALGGDWALVLMDVQMPELDGLEATRRLRAAGVQTPVLAMTAHAMAEAREQCLQAGMDDHLAKPLEPARLHEALLQWVTPPPSVPPSAPDSHDTPAPPLQEAAGPQPVLQETLPELPGVDTRAGLATLGGNERLYRQLLQRFADTHGSAAEELAQALEAGDAPRTRSMAHALKGVAANLGARNLADAAAALEKCCKAEQDATACAPALQSLAAHLEEVLTSLASLPGEHAAPPQAPDSPADGKPPARIAPLLRSLYRSLENDLGESLRSLEELRPLCGGGLQAHFAALEKDLAVFDTDAARGHAEALAQEAGVSLHSGTEPPEN